MQEQKRKDGWKELWFRIVMIFTLGCFLGCVFEEILCFAQRGHFESRQGVIYGPFNPVYGFGAVLCMIILEKYQKVPSLFLVGAWLGGTFEYLCSWFQENVFGTTSWHYSKYAINFDGRTSLFHMIWWGVFAVLFIKVIYPWFLKWIDKIKVSQRLGWTLFLLLFFCFNMTISSLACLRQEERMQQIEAKNFVDKFLDRHYPDSKLNRIFPNRKNAKTQEKIK